MAPPDGNDGTMSSFTPGGAAAAASWLMTFDPIIMARIQRTTWDDRQIVDEARYNKFAVRGPHYLESKIAGGKVQVSLGHMGIDRRVRHTAADRHGECSSHFRCHDNFEALVSDRLGVTPQRALSAEERQQQAERIEQRRSEAKAKQLERLKERNERKQAAEAIMMPAPRRSMTRQRMAREARRRSDSSSPRPRSAPPPQTSRAGPAASSIGSPRAHQPSLAATNLVPLSDIDAARLRLEWARGGRRRGSSGGAESRLTGQYVHSMGDVGRIEREPADRRTPGRERISDPRAARIFEASLRDHPPRRCSSGSPRLHMAGWRGAALWPADQISPDNRMPWSSRREAVRV